MARTVLFAFLLFLVFDPTFSHVMGAGEVKNKAGKILGVALTQTKTKDFQEARRPDYLVAATMQIAVPLLVAFLLFFGVGVFVFFNVKKNTPTIALGTKGPQNPMEKYAPYWMAVIAATLIIVHQVWLKPTKGSSGSRTNQYRIIGTVGVIVCATSLMVSTFVLQSSHANHLLTFVLGYVMAFAFCSLLLLQVFTATLVGEFQMFSGMSDSTISSSMDYLSGQILATFGLGVIAAFIPSLEALHKGGWKYGRGLRMLFSALADMALVWVTLSPIKNDNVDGRVSAEMQKRWNNFHYPAAGLAFGSLYTYIIMVTFDHISALGGKGLFFNYLGFIVASLGVAMLAFKYIYKLFQKAESDTVNQIFAIGEFTLVAAVFPTLVQRYTLKDMTQLENAVARWGCNAVGDCHD